MRKNGRSAVLVWVDASGNTWNLWLRSCPQSCRGTHERKAIWLVALNLEMTMESQWNNKDTWSFSYWLRQPLVFWLQKYASRLILMNSSERSVHPTNSNLPTFGLTLYVLSKSDPALEGGQQLNHFRRFPPATPNSCDPVISSRWNMFLLQTKTNNTYVFIYMTSERCNDPRPKWILIGPFMLVCFSRMQILVI